MKKIFLFLLTAILVLALAGCGEVAAPESSNQSTPTTPTTTAPAFDKVVAHDSELGVRFGGYINFAEWLGSFTTTAEISPDHIVSFCFSEEMLGIDTGMVMDFPDGMFGTCTVSVERLNAITQTVLGYTYDYTAVDSTDEFTGHTYYDAATNSLIRDNTDAIIGGGAMDIFDEYDYKDEEAYTTEDGINYTLSYSRKRIHLESGEVTVYRQGFVTVKKIDDTYRIISHTAEINLES